MATALIVLLSLGFSYFISQFATYNKLYGSLGTLLVTLIWLNANSVVLLLGFELDAAIHRARKDGLEGAEALRLSQLGDGRADDCD
jgi:membrane protein